MPWVVDKKSVLTSLGDPTILMQVVFQISPRIFKIASKPAVRTIETNNIFGQPARNELNQVLLQLYTYAM